MWSPDGYRPFEEFLDDLLDIADDEIESRKEEFAADEAPAPFFRGGRFHVAAIHLGIAANVLRHTSNPVRICSPSGVVLRPTWRMWVAMPAFSEVKPPYEFSDLRRISGFIEAYARGYFAFVDPYLWQVRIPDLRGIPNKMSSEGCDIREVCSYLSAFDGWSLCVPDTLSPETWWDVYEDEALGSDDANGPPGLPKSPGRPALVPVVAKIIEDDFSNERGDLSWKQLSMEVSQRLGRRVSTRTIQRAMRQNLRHRASETDNIAPEPRA